MTEQEQFEDTIYNNPKDKTARLVYADWLDEHDDPDYARGLRIVPDKILTEDVDGIFEGYITNKERVLHYVDLIDQCEMIKLADEIKHHYRGPLVTRQTIQMEHEQEKRRQIWINLISRTIRPVFRYGGGTVYGLTNYPNRSVQYWSRTWPSVDFSSIEMNVNRAQLEQEMINYQYNLQRYLLLTGMGVSPVSMPPAGFIWSQATMDSVNPPPKEKKPDDTETV